MQKNKIVAISDIHGHYDELIQLMYKIGDKWNVDVGKDTFIFLGDYVDGGYKSKQVISRLIQWQKQYPHWIFLKGNHEQMMLDALKAEYHSSKFELWYEQGGKATALNYVPKKKLPQYLSSRHATQFIYKTHLEWVDSLPLFVQIDDYLFVHAGIDPELGLQTSASDMLWIREPFLSSKKDFGFKVIFGHTVFPPDLEPLVMKNKIGIDTMMHNNGKITAILLPEEKFLSQESSTINDLDWNMTFGF